MRPTRASAATLAIMLVVVVRAGPAPTTSHRQTGTPRAPLASAREVDAAISQGESLLDAHKPADAKAAFERALEAARRLALEPQQAVSLCGIGRALVQHTQYKDARDFGLRCLEIYERLSLPHGIGEAQLVLDVAAELSGDYAEARTRAEQAIAAFESAGDRRGRAVATLNLLRVDKSPPIETDRLLARAIDDAQAAGDRHVEANALHSWGDGLFARDRYDEAFDKLDRAAKMYDALGDRVALGTVFNSLGRLYRAHGRLDEALRFQQKALDLHRTSGDPLSIMQSLNAVAAVSGMLGNPASAREYTEQALVIAERSSSPRIQDFLRANLATYLLNQGEFARGASMLEAVIAHGADSFPSQRQSQLAYARLKLGQPQQAMAAAEQALTLCGDRTSDCASALQRRAEARAALGDRAGAVRDVDDALGRVEDIRKTLVPADFFKQEFHRVREGLYSEAIALKIGIGQDASALETAELARSRAFLDLLASRSIATAAPASAANVAASAARLHSTFLLYWVAEDGVAIWVVTPDGRTRARRVSLLRSTLEELVRTTAWRQLYDLLIGPVRDILPHAPDALLTIVPHGPLHNLSFAALQDARGRYLLEDYTLHYVSAAAVLQLTSARGHPDGRSGRVLIVADPAMPVRSKLDRPLDRLPGARVEADDIARLVPRDRITLLRDAEATEAAVRTAATGKAVLHFATHAVLRDDNPLGSFLALSPVAGAKNGDGLLTAQDVYGWTLNADLVVLSACQSGGGRITGDGVATFTRAFIYAGAPSLVASLWDVADEPTNRLVAAFYRSWLGGQSKARALRAAQLQLLRDLRAGAVHLQTPAGLVTLAEHPVLWAGFVLVGEPD